MCDCPLSLAEVLDSEFHYLDTGKASSAQPSSPVTDAPTRQPQDRLRDEVIPRLHTLDRSALCLSGGGIRSATFNLGIMQGLARMKALAEFDYLSTVSGGGFIGSWLNAWIYRAKTVVEVEELLAQHAPEPDEIKWLRKYSNYLTPRLGLMSADSWTLVATYARNLILNWLVFLPVLMLGLLAPRVCLWIVRQLSSSNSWQTIAPIVLGVILLVKAISFIAINRPSNNRFPAPTQGQYLRSFLLWLCCAAILITSGWAGLFPLINPLQRVNAGMSLGNIWLIVFLSFLILSWVTIFVALFLKNLDTRGGGVKPAHVEILASLISSFASCALLCAVVSRDVMDPNHYPTIYTVFAFPSFLLSFLVGGILLRALTSKYTTDDDREWAARSAGWILVCVVCWLALASLVLFGPSLLLMLGTIGRATVVSVGGICGAATAILGKSYKTPATIDQARKLGDRPQWRQIVLAVAAPLFIIFLLTALTLTTDWLISRVDGNLRDAWSTENWQEHAGWHAQVLKEEQIGWIGIVALGFTAIGLIMSSYVNINKFSLHTSYRNRLIRAYLGASTKNRDAKTNPFTGFNPDDNFAFHLTGRNKLFHVVNVALNLVSGKNLAWQQRKAASFTISPLHCGTNEMALGYRTSTVYGGGLNNGSENRPISLGTAMAISGAAASPNMGSHSSPPLAFLMTFLNVRVGAWLGNPGPNGARTYGLSSPTQAMLPLFDEAFGLTDDSYEYVYLSDGGHFENLALYEMVQRRCRRIIVCDAGHDETFAFDDLGNAVRKIRADLNIRISFEEKMLLRPRAKDAPKPETGRYCAVGTIHYEEVDKRQGSDRPAPSGTILYIKPAFYEDKEPIDVMNYGKSSPNFPHESTADQFFSESQFESYRALGEYIVKLAGDNAGGNSGIDGVLLGALKVLEAPRILNIAPDSGVVDGGTPVTLRGYFPDNPNIYFGSKIAANVTKVSDFEVHAASPAANPGQVDIVVTARVGSESKSHSLPKAFEYAPPPST